MPKVPKKRAHQRTMPTGPKPPRATRRAPNHLQLQPLPKGPPLFLEVPGAARRHLSPFLTAARVARMNDLLDRRTKHLSALVENIHDPHNIAACVRSCDAFGIQNLYIVSPTDDLKVQNDISRGSHRWLTIHYYDRVEDAVADIRAAGYLLGATDLGGDSPPTSLPDVSIDAPTCIAFGNEHAGISNTLRDLTDFRVRIPMQGFVESLNISVAFAVTMFHLRQRLDSERGSDAGDLDDKTRDLLIDRWIFEDVPHGRRVLEELARRAQTALKSDAASD